MTKSAVLDVPRAIYAAISFVLDPLHSLAVLHEVYSSCGGIAEAHPYNGTDVQRSS